MPSRAYASLLRDALAKLEFSSDKCVNALSGWYLIATKESLTARLPETGVSMPSRASTSLLRATVLCQSSWGYTCQCPLGLVPHCYVRSAVVHSVNKDGVSMPSRASTSLLLFRSVKDLRVINSYVSMPSRASTSLLPAILGNIGRMTSLCQCPLGLVPHCYSTPSKT